MPPLPRSTLKLADLANALGVVPSMVSHLKAAGMPTDSVYSAVVWRVKNQPRPASRSHDDEYRSR